MRAEIDRPPGVHRPRIDEGEKTRTVLAGTRNSGPMGGFVLVVLVIVVLVVIAVFALHQSTDDQIDVAHGTIATSATTSALAEGSPAARPAATGDVDGDGRPDATDVLPGPRAAGGGPYDDVLQVHASRLGLLQLDLDADNRPLAAKAPVDINGDGYADVLIQVGSEGIETRDEVVSLTADGLGIVSIDGQFLMLSDGKVGSNISSWDCVGSGGQVGHPGLIRDDLLAKGPSGGWTLEVTTYEIRGAVAQQVGHSTKAVSQADGLAQVRSLHRCGAQR